MHRSMLRVIVVGSIFLCLGWTPQKGSRCPICLHGDVVMHVLSVDANFGGETVAVRLSSWTNKLLLHYYIDDMFLLAVQCCNRFFPV